MNNIRIFTIVLLINSSIFSFSDKCSKEYGVDNIQINKDEKGLYLGRPEIRVAMHTGNYNYLFEQRGCLILIGSQKKFASRFAIKDKNIDESKVELVSNSPKGKIVNEISDLIFKVDGVNYFVDIESWNKGVFYLTKISEKQTKSILKSKSYDFAKRVVKLYKYLSFSKKEYVLSKQLLRSGTSIGAMVRESEFGQSKADFINKLSIGLKEANESEYWLELLKDSEYLSEQEFSSIQQDLLEVIKMLISSIKTAKNIK